MKLPLLALWLLLPGCGKAPAAQADPHDSAIPAEAPVDLSLDRVWGPAEVEAALDQLGMTGLLSAATLNSAFRATILPSLDQGCFSSQTTDDGWTSVNYGGDCTTHDGLTIEGMWLYQWREGASPATYELGALTSVELQATDGRAFLGGGTFTARETQTEDGRHLESEVGGTFQSTAAGPGLSQGLSLGMSWVIDHGNQGAHGLLTGSFQLADGPAVFFDEVIFDPTLCEGLPVGTISVRDPSSIWIDLPFTEACTPCVEAQVDGASIGTVCGGDRLKQAGGAAISAETLRGEAP